MPSSALDRRRRAAEGNRRRRRHGHDLRLRNLITQILRKARSAAKLELSRENLKSQAGEVRFRGKQAQERALKERDRRRAERH